MPPVAAMTTIEIENLEQAEVLAAYAELVTRYGSAAIYDTAIAFGEVDPAVFVAELLDAGV